jgi:hypothetical protein
VNRLALRRGSSFSTPDTLSQFADAHGETCGIMRFTQRATNPFARVRELGAGERADFSAAHFSVRA